MDKVTVWCDIVAGMINPPAYNNYIWWAKYKYSYLNMRKNHQNQETANGIIHERKELF